MTPNRSNRSGDLDVKGIIALIIICASWGINQAAIKFAIQSVPPVLQSGIRSAGAVILVLLWMRLRKIPIFVKDKTLFWGLLVGVLFSLEFFLIYWGLEFTHASRSVIFLYTSPFVVALGAHFFIEGDTLNKRQVMGLFLAFLGIVVAFNESMNLPTKQMLIGDLMLVGAAFIWGSSTVVVKASVISSIAPSRALLYQLAVSAVLLPAASWFLGEPGLEKLTLAGGLSLVYQTVWVAFVSYIAWFWLIKNYTVSKMASFTFLTPLFGVMAGTVLLNEPLSVSLVFSLVLVSCGIYLVNR